jgi:hypothetical protein
MSMRSDDLATGAMQSELRTRDLDDSLARDIGNDAADTEGRNRP